MYSTTSLVDYEVWEEVDITGQAWEHREITGTAMESLPAAARRVNQWVRKRTSNCWNYDTNCREAVAHFMITDDLKKTNMQVNKFLEDVFHFYNDQIRQQINRYLCMIAYFSDNCGYQFKSR